jgi:hypothetical protein
MARCSRKRIFLLEGSRGFSPLFYYNWSLGASARSGANLGGATEKKEGEFASVPGIDALRQTIQSDARDRGVSQHFFTPGSATEKASTKEPRPHPIAELDGNNSKQPARSRAVRASAPGFSEIIVTQAMLCASEANRH